MEGCDCHGRLLLLLLLLLSCMGRTHHPRQWQRSKRHAAGNEKWEQWLVARICHRTKSFQYRTTWNWAKCTEQSNDEKYTQKKSGPGKLENMIRILSTSFVIEPMWLWTLLGSINCTYIFYIGNYLFIVRYYTSTWHIWYYMLEIFLRRILSFL